MGKPLSPDRVFYFPMDEPEPHLAYDFFTPIPLQDEPIVVPVVDEIAKPIIKIEEQVIQVRDAEAADCITIREIGPRVPAVEGQVKRGQQTATQRDEVIVGLSQQCIIGMDRRLANLERRPPGPYIMGKPLSPDRVFYFPMDEPEPHLAYDFFTPGPLQGMREDIAMLFDDDDFSDDNSKGFEDDEEVCEVNKEWLMALVTPPLMPVYPHRALT
nr:hypothetical protein [Tanacetum cinerariifolium]